MFRKAWRTLPWIPVLWTVDDAVVSARKIDRARCGVVLEGGEGEEEEDLIKSELESETRRIGGKRERDVVYAVLDKVSYRYEDVARGDAVCVPRPGSSRGFNSFSSSSLLEVQRVVALENDLVAWKTKTRKNTKRGREEEKEESRDATVPKGHCFIASENENVEHVGIVPIALIEAKVRYAVVFDGGAARVRATKASAKKEEEESRGGKVVVRRRYF
jgi:hypothetical protein